MNATSTAAAQGKEVLQIHSVTECSPGILCFSDEFQHRLGFLTDETGETRFVGGEGTEPGQFRYPSGLAFWQERLYVSDTWNHRVQVLTLDGTPVTAFGSYGPERAQFDCPLDLAVAPDGDHLWVLDSGNHAVKIFNRDHELEDVLDQNNLDLAPPRLGAALAMKANPEEKKPALHYPRRLLLDRNRWLVLDNHGGSLIQERRASARFTNLYSCYLKPLKLFDSHGLFYYSVDHSLVVLDFSGAVHVTVQVLPEDTVAVFRRGDGLYRCDNTLSIHPQPVPELSDIVAAVPVDPQNKRALVRLLGDGPQALLHDRDCSPAQRAFFQRLDRGVLAAEDLALVRETMNACLRGIDQALAALQACPVAYLPHIRYYGPMSEWIAPDQNIKKSYLTYSAAKIFADLENQIAALAELVTALPKEVGDETALGFLGEAWAVLIQSGERVFTVKKDALVAVYDLIKEELGGVSTAVALKASLQSDFWLAQSDVAHQQDAIIMAADQVLAAFERLLTAISQRPGLENLPADWPASAEIAVSRHQAFALSNFYFKAARENEPVLQAFDPTHPETAFTPACLPYYAAAVWAGSVESWTVDQVERARARVCSVAAGNLVFLAQQVYFQPQALVLREFFLLPSRFSVHGIGSFLARCGQTDLLDTVVAFREEPFFANRKTHELEMAGVETVLGRFPSAKSWLAKWISDGSAKVALLHFAFLEAAAGEQAAAETRFAALSEDPAYPLFYGRAAPFLGKIDEAVAVIEARCTDFSLDLFLVYNGLLNLNGAAEKALQFQATQADQPEWSRHWVAANSFWALGRLDEALARLQALPRGTAACLDTHHVALLRANGDETGAAQHALVALKDRPGDMLMQLQQMMTWLKAGDDTAAEQLRAATRAWLFTREGVLHGKDPDFFPMLRRMVAAEGTARTWGADLAADAVALHLNLVHPFFRLT
ncbi:NHL repeat-containing protein [Acanthopleuribacter pedis]|uniref:NHL repeat-containing protein n=1 Tax=Acanthopleuribacter pedis TaxID=442870 RepID=A0A8J7Q4H4_9BACT|nr:NHL repeat-containing protein [Acanthopleuribacter pedis]MBO1318009.1 NHL repeat-containing protein [Acanthopleuribacter pedis]